MLAEYGWCWPSKAKYEGGQSIAYKYRKGKLKSTSNEELKEHEIRPMRIGDPGPSKSAGGVRECPAVRRPVRHSCGSRTQVPLGQATTVELLRGHGGSAGPTVQRDLAV